MALVFIYIVIAALWMGAVLAPFCFGERGFLQEGAAVSAPADLEARCTALVEKYVEDEESFQKGFITSGEWRRRQMLLVNRYVDAVRRLDFLKGSGKP